MRSRFLLVAVAGALGLGAGIAHADSHATASFSQIQFTVYDLAPTDGVAAAVSFDSYLGSYAFNYAFGSAGIGPQGDSRSTALGGPVAASSVFDARTSASSAFGGDVWAGTGRATASAQAGAPGFSQSLAELFLNFDGAHSFTLSPHTLLTISGWADVAVGGTDPLAYEGAAADVSLSLSGSIGDSRQLSDAALTVSTDGGPLSRAGWLSVSFLNSSGSEASGLFGLRTDASAQFTSTSAVPEPGPLALLLAGAGVLMMGARRRIAR